MSKLDALLIDARGSLAKNFGRPSFTAEIRASSMHRNGNSAYQLLLSEFKEESCRSPRARAVARSVNGLTGCSLVARQLRAS